MAAFLLHHPRLPAAHSYEEVEEEVEKRVDEDTGNGGKKLMRYKASWTMKKERRDRKYYTNKVKGRNHDREKKRQSGDKEKERQAATTR